MLIDTIWFQHIFIEMRGGYIHRENLLLKYRDTLKSRFAAAGKRKSEHRSILVENDGLTSLKVGRDAFQAILPLFEKYFSIKLRSISAYLDESDYKIIKEALTEIERAIPIPSPLTLKLWRALKWAQPAEWNLHAALLNSSYFLDEEKLITPINRKNTEVNMRITLAGEDMEIINGVKFLVNDNSSDTKEVIRARLMRELYDRGRGEELSIKKIYEAADKIAKERAPKDERVEMGRVVSAFKSVVKDYSLKKLLHRVKEFPIPVQLILFHRLGYNHPTLPEVADYSIEYLIKDYFDSSHYNYYKILEYVTRILRGDSHKSRNWDRLNRLVEKVIPSVMASISRNSRTDRSYDEWLEVRKTEDIPMDLAQAVTTNTIDDDGIPF